MKVLIPSPVALLYRRRARWRRTGASLAALLADLDARYPGLRFRMIDEQDRIRRHMRVFVNNTQTFDMNHPLGPGDSVAIVQALSGG